MAQRQIPGGPFLNETATAQRQIPGGPFVNETTSAGGGGATTALIGQSISSAQGTPAVVGSANVALTTQALTLSLGTPDAKGSSLWVATGIGITAGQGVPGVLGSARVSVIGQSLTALYGTPIVSGSARVTLLGEAMSFALGTWAFPVASQSLSFDINAWRQPNVKPIGPVKINWSHPLAGDLYKLFYADNGVIRELISGDIYDLGSGAASYDGEAAYSTTDVALSLGRLYPKKLGVTALTIYTPSQNATVYHVFWYQGAGTTSPYNGFTLGGVDIYEMSFVVSIANNAYEFCWQVGNYPGDTYLVASSGVAPVVGTPVILGGRFDDSGFLSVFVDGVLRSTTANSQSITTAYDWSVSYLNNVGYAAETERFMRGATPILAVFDRSLSDVEVTELSSDLYALLESDVTFSVKWVPQNFANVALGGISLSMSFGTIAPGTITTVSADNTIVVGESNAALVGFGFTGKTSVKLTSGGVEVAQTGLNVASDTSGDFDIVQGNLPYGTVTITLE